MSLMISKTFAQSSATPNRMLKTRLNQKEIAIISIASRAAKGDLVKLKKELNIGLDNGLTINEAKEVLIHIYAYCGFPRSIRGLQTLMEVVSDRKTKGVADRLGSDASPKTDSSNKYERGKKILNELSGAREQDPFGYRAFAPAIDTFLKEHLFADIFERDVLTYQQRELTTIAVLTTIGDAEPMLKSHYGICLNVGITADQLKEFTTIIKSKAGPKKTGTAETVLEEVLKNRQTEIK